MEEQIVHKTDDQSEKENDWKSESVSKVQELVSKDTVEKIKKSASVALVGVLLFGSVAGAGLGTYNLLEQLEQESPSGVIELQVVPSRQEYDKPGVHKRQIAELVEQNLDKQYMNVLLDAIQTEETGRGGKQKKLEELVWKTRVFRHKIGSTGPYELGRDIARKIVRDNKKYFQDIDSNNDYEIHQDEIDQYIRTEEGARKVVKFLVLDNLNTLENIYSKVDNDLPGKNSLQRIIFLGTSYNKGAIRPIVSGIQYSMKQVGIPYQGKIDGKIGDRTIGSFIKWAEENDYDITADQIRKDFQNLSSFVGSQSWEVLNQAYNNQYNENAKLLVPIDYIWEDDNYSVDNYGLRVAATIFENGKQVQCKEKIKKNFQEWIIGYKGDTKGYEQQLVEKIQNTSKSEKRRKLLTKIFELRYWFNNSNVGQVDISSDQMIDKIASLDKAKKDQLGIQSDMTQSQIREFIGTKKGVQAITDKLRKSIIDGNGMKEIFAHL